jgi:NADPH:quinone reductase-like Zn-dependent oxidoreductase
MQAVVYTEYGSPDVLQFKEVPTPIPRDDEILIKIHAASLNRSDWEGLTGSPAYARMGGLFRPRDPILGSDVAGRVEVAGKNHTRFRPGDDVYGDIMESSGGFAEYVCVRGTNLLPKPAWMSFEQAAAIPQAAVIALKGIRQRGRVQPGEKVLINGAGGGSGMFAIQLAKQSGAVVTGVDNAGKLDFMRTLGADHVIDYAREDFTSNGPQYDLILDMFAHRSPFAYARALRPNGRAYAAGGLARTLLKILVAGPVIALSTRKRVRVLAAMPNRADIATIAELCETGTIRLVIDRVFPLREVPEALRYLGEGRARGKVVIRVA